MLRWIVLLVLLGNIFAAFWFHSLGEFRRVPVSGDSSTSAVPGIFLLGELSDPIMPQRSVCLLYGSFSGRQQAIDTQLALKKSGVRAVLVAEDISSGVDYWVYIPVEGFGGDPARIVRELKANNLNSFVFGPGELEGAISIGVFSSTDEARDQERRMQRLGYDVQIHEMPRLIREYWLGLSQREQEKAADFDWQSIAEHKITRRKVEIPCERVASHLQFP